MTINRKPAEAFRRFAAKRLGVAEDALGGGGPIDASVAHLNPQTIGAAWQYRYFVNANPERVALGWANADGTVITVEQNLGLLFVEAGVWTPAPKLNAAALAGFITWSLGMMNRVYDDPIRPFPPTLTMNLDGTGELRFLVAWRPPGPGGAGGGVEDITLVTVKLSADHQATFTRTAFDPNAPR